MQGPDGNYWTTDNDLFLGLGGAREVVDWFGYVPSFHDATLIKFELGKGSAQFALQSFRITNEVDEKGYFVLDCHALVTVHLSGVTGVSLMGDASSTIQELGIRRVVVSQTGWDTVAGPAVGDYEVRWESSWGLEGAIFARDVRFSLAPASA